MAKTVFVGMSGGVDSSLSAALLCEQGYNVMGVYMKNWSQDLPGHHCPWKEDYQDAMRVAVQLGIDFKVYDFQTEYRQKVVDYMVAEYQAGCTPNPDIMCNQEVKFKLFLDTALADGADLIATGHYARIKRVQSPETRAPSSQLWAANDKNKDQSYFLYRVTEAALAKTLFPIGEFTKPEVRKMAKKRGLATAAKKDSQGICFVGKVGIKEFLLHELGSQPQGAIIDQNGKQIGQHDGAIFYTLGQRHGLSVGGGLPYYVTAKDMAKNEVYVTTNLDDSNLWSQSLHLADVHWINGKPLAQQKEEVIRSTNSGQVSKKDKEKVGKKEEALASSLLTSNLPLLTYSVRTRYRAPLVNCTLQVVSSSPSTLRVALSDQVRAVTPGQSAVLYDGNQVLGGGIVI